MAIIFYHFTGTIVTHLKFVVREDADSLVIAANSENGGFVEVWELREKSQPVHKLFQPKSLEPFKTVASIQLLLQTFILFLFPYSLSLCLLQYSCNVLPLLYDLRYMTLYNKNMK